MESTYIAGLHSVKAALRSTAGQIEALFVQRDRRDTRLRDLREIARKHGISTREVARAELNELVPDVQHQGVVALLRTGSTTARGNLISYIQKRRQQAGAPSLLILVLDGVQDPHNLGACLRSADATGVDAVITPSDNSVGLTTVVRKVASGAAETVALFQVSNLQRTITELQELGIWVYGAAGEAPESLFMLDLTGDVALVMGAEGRGMRRLTRERCDGLFKLPMMGSVSSLNVSVATGIALYEALRQRS